MLIPIPTLIGCGMLCYAAWWLRGRYSGRIQLIPGLVLLRLLALAALIYAGIEVWTHLEDGSLHVSLH